MGQTTADGRSPLRGAGQSAEPEPLSSRVSAQGATVPNATFADLQFGAHPNGLGQQARHKFPNGYEVSVVSGPYFYTDAEHPYELAVTHPDVGLVYDTPVTDDVLGYLTEDDVTRHMGEVEALPERVSA